MSPLTSASPGPASDGGACSSTCGGPRRSRPCDGLGASGCTGSCPSRTSGRGDRPEGLLSPTVVGGPRARRGERARVIVLPLDSVSPPPATGTRTTLGSRGGDGGPSGTTTGGTPRHGLLGHSHRAACPLSRSTTRLSFGVPTSSAVPNLRCGRSSTSSVSSSLLLSPVPTPPRPPAPPTPLSYTTHASVPAEPVVRTRTQPNTDPPGPSTGTVTSPSVDHNPSIRTPPSLPTSDPRHQGHQHLQLTSTLRCLLLTLGRSLVYLGPPLLPNPQGLYPFPFPS